MTTDQEVLSWLQRRVAETDDAGATWPSGLWSAIEVLGYMNEWQAKLLGDTAMDIAAAEIPYLSGVPVYALPQDCGQVTRCTWIAQNGTTRPIEPGTSFAADLSNRLADRQPPQRPLRFLLASDVPQGYIRFTPLVNTGGRVRLSYIPTGDQVDGSGQILVIPDECVPGYRWAVLSSMLSRAGRGQNLPLATYALGRYHSTVAAMSARIAGIW